VNKLNQVLLPVAFVNDAYRKATRLKVVKQCFSKAPWLSVVALLSLLLIGWFICDSFQEIYWWKTLLSNLALFCWFFSVRKWIIDAVIYDAEHAVIDKHFSLDYQLIRYRQFKEHLEISMKEAGISALKYDEIRELLNLRRKFRPSANFNFPFPQTLITILTAILTSLATQKEMIDSGWTVLCALILTVLLILYYIVFPVLRGDNYTDGELDYFLKVNELESKA